MKILFVAPEKSGYYDGTTWFTHNQRNPNCEGLWLKPGETVVVLSPEESEEIPVMAVNLT